jgi:hypothetical protein
MSSTTKTFGRFSKPEAKKMKFTPVEKPTGTVVYHPDIGECVLFMTVSGQNIREQYTVHRPIGETKLDKEKSWVITKSTDLPDLLARKSNPNKTLIEETVKTHLYRLIPESIVGVTIRDGQLYVYDVSRADIISIAKTAQSKHEKEMADLKAPPDTTATTTSPPVAVRPKVVKPKVKPLEKSDYTDFLGSVPWLQAKEREIRTWMKTNADHIRKEVETVFPYETRSGPMADRPQVEAIALRGMTTAQISDWCTNTLLRAATIPLEKKIPEVKVVAVDKPPDTSTSSAKKKPMDLGALPFKGAPPIPDPIPGSISTLLVPDSKSVTSPNLVIPSVTAVPLTTSSLSSTSSSSTHDALKRLYNVKAISPPSTTNLNP